MKDVIFYLITKVNTELTLSRKYWK